jgi:hypothetical protein
MRPLPARLRPPLRRWGQRLAVLAVFTAAVAALVGPSLAGDRVVLPHDLQLDRLPWSALADEPVEPANPELRDLLDVYYPVQHALLERVRSGASTRWLHDVSLGLPGTSFVGWGATSPFNAVALVAPFDWAWSLAIGARLLVAMLGAYALARAYGSGRVGGTVAGLAFGLSGFMVGWLGWPQAHVGAFIPWVLWGARQAAAPTRAWWAVPALAFATAGLWLGGFPAVSSYALLAAVPVALHAAVRGSDGWRRTAGGVGWAGAGLVLGTALAAFTLLPSVLLLDELHLAVRADAWRADLPLVALALFVAPGVFGDVVHSPWLFRVAYVEAIGYAGVVPLALTLPAWLLAPRRVGLGLWTGIAVGFGALVYGAEPLQRLMSVVPLLRENPPTRTIVLVGLAVAVLGGLGADAVVGAAARRTGATWRSVLAAAVAGASLAVLALVTLGQLDEAVLARARPAQAEAALANAFGHVAVAGGLVVAAGLVAAGALLVGRRHERAGVAVAAGGLVALVAADLLVFAGGWNVQVPRDTLFPDAPGIDALTAVTREGYRVAGADGVAHPNTHLEYGFADVRSHAFLTPRQRAVLDRLDARRLSPTRWDLDSTDSDDWEPWLSLLGVRAVLTHASVDAVPGVAPAGAEPRAPLPPLTRFDSGVAATVRAPRTGILRGVTVRVGTYRRANEGHVLVHVTGSDGQRRLGRRWVGDLTDNAWVTVPFRGLPVEAGDRVRVRVRGTADSADAAISVWGSGTGEARAPALGLAYGRPWRRRDLGPVRLFTNPDARPVVTALANAVPVDSGGAALRGIARGGAAGLATTTWVEDSEGTCLPAGGGHAEVSDWTRGGGITRATVRSDRGAVLVVADQALPGWSARIDGLPAPVVVADHLFLGVVVPHGTHEVVLTYAPPGAALGRLLSLAAALVLAAVSLARWRASRTRSRREPPKAEWRSPYPSKQPALVGATAGSTAAHAARRSAAAEHAVDRDRKPGKHR